MCSTPGMSPGLQANAMTCRVAVRSAAEPRRQPGPHEATRLCGFGYGIGVSSVASTSGRSAAGARRPWAPKAAGSIPAAQTTLYGPFRWSSEHGHHPYADTTPPDPHPVLRLVVTALACLAALLTLVVLVP